MPVPYVDEGVIAWNQWCTTITASSCTTATSALIWSNWTQATSATTWEVNLSGWDRWNADYVETQEQRAARQLADAAQRQRRIDERRQFDEQRAARWQEHRAATDRATELLTSLLNEEQLATLRSHGYFDVIGSKGNRYRIRTSGQSGNVDLMGEDNVRELSYCAHPPEMLPDPDAHVAQMLTLVTDEDAFVRTANVQHRRRQMEPGLVHAVA